MFSKLHHLVSKYTNLLPIPTEHLQLVLCYTENTNIQQGKSSKLAKSYLTKTKKWDWTKQDGKIFFLYGCTDTVGYGKLHSFVLKQLPSELTKLACARPGFLIFELKVEI